MSTIDEKRFACSRAKVKPLIAAVSKKTREGKIKWFIEDGWRGYEARLGDHWVCISPPDGKLGLWFSIHFSLRSGEPNYDAAPYGNYHTERDPLHSALKTLFTAVERQVGGLVGDMLTKLEAL